LKPIEAIAEMDLGLDEAVQRLRTNRRYRRDFAAAFDEEPNADDLARSLAAYVRTILAGNSRYDRYLYGKSDVLSERELAGLELFRGKAGCVICHAGPNFSDERFHNTGVAWRDGGYLDEGRAIVTGRLEDLGKFKTPTLREVSDTAPYMHDGSLASLEDVVDFYDQGGRQNPNLDPKLRRLHLTEEQKGALAAFLRSLTGRVREGP
jgi:cytochrome c peroxidase